MNDQDVKYMQTPSLRWKAWMRCAVCSKSPSCPMLKDEVWALISVAATISHETCFVCSHAADRHYSTAERRGRHCNDCGCRALEFAHDLLCFECAEIRLGREIILEDLLPCLGNLAHFIMQTRAESRGGVK